MKHYLKRNDEKIFAYLLDKQIECFTFNIIQHHTQMKTITQQASFASLRQEQ